MRAFLTFFAVLRVLSVQVEIGIVFWPHVCGSLASGIGSHV
jgi:hypothetical protein